MYGANAFGWVYPGQPFLAAGIPKSDSDAGVASENTALKVVITTPEPGQIGSYGQFPLSFQTYSQVLGAYPTYNAISTGSAPLPQLTETATIKFGLATADTNGTTTETASVAFLPVATDTATGIDTATIKAPILVSDTNGATTETGSLVGQLAATDVNAGITETASFIGKESDADVNGSTTETFSVVAKITATDTNSTSETASVVAKVSDTDVNGSVTESVNLARQVTDTNAGITETTTLVIVSSVSDAITTTETTAVVAKVSDNDPTGPEIETASLTVAITVTDTNGATTESASYIGKLASADVNGVTSEISALNTVSVLADGNGATTETQSTVGKIIAYEPGTAGSYTDILQSFPTYSALSISYPTYGSITTGPPPLPRLDEFAFIVFPAVQDASGPVTEAPLLAAKISGTDSGTSVEYTAGNILAIDAATAAETASVVVKNFTTQDSNGPTTESGSPAKIVTDAGVISEATQLVARYVDIDNNATTTETAGQARFSTDANGITTENASYVVKVTPISASDVATASETASIRTTATDVNGSVSESASPEIHTADSNLIVAESALVTLPTADEATGSDTAAPRAFVAVQDTNDATYEWSVKTLPDEYWSRDFATASEIASVVKEASVAVEQNGYTVEVEAIRLAIPADALQASEIASVALALPTYADVGLGADSASLAFSGASSDIGTASETAQVAVKLPVGDQSGIFYEIGTISVRVVTTDSGHGTDSQAGRILVLDSGRISETATLTFAQFWSYDTGTAFEFQAVKKTVIVPPGGPPLLTAVDGIDVTYLTAVIGDSRAR